MRSPISGQPMAQIEYEGAIIHTCQQSGGEFIGPDALAHIIRTRDERFPLVMHESMVDRQPKLGVDPVEPERALRCPGCDGVMRLMNYSGDSGVHVDRCDDCGGVWLDRDELEHIQVLMERWWDEAPQQVRAIAGDIESARQAARANTENAFEGSRFAFVNALINRFLDAA